MSTLRETMELRITISNLKATRKNLGFYFSRRLNMTMKKFPNLYHNIEKLMRLDKYARMMSPSPKRETSTEMTSLDFR
jgi:predicted ester cyclase